MIPAYWLEDTYLYFFFFSEGPLVNSKIQMNWYLQFRLKSTQYHCFLSNVSWQDGIGESCTLWMLH